MSRIRDGETAQPDGISQVRILVSSSAVLVIGCIGSIKVEALRRLSIAEVWPLYATPSFDS